MISGGPVSGQRTLGGLTKRGRRNEEMSDRR
jgi:hypothetical protein